MPEAVRIEQSEAFEGMQALAEACARNTPVEVVRRGRGTQEPPAKGRFIEIRDDCLVIEKVHVIGRDVHFSPGSDIECYFNYAGTILYFKSRIIDAGQPVKLNQQVVLPGMRVELPEVVQAGQRRQVFRVILCTLPTPPRVEIWSHRDIVAAHDKAMADFQVKVAKAPEPNALVPPTRVSMLDTISPTFQGVAADGSDTGLGVLLPNVVYTRVKMYEWFWMRITLPRETAPILTIAEVRHTRELPGIGARLGMIFLGDECANAGFTFQVRRFVQFLTQVQRERKH